MPTDLGCRKGGIEHGNRSRRGKRPKGDQEKFIGNFTKRQVICFGAAAVVGVPFYLLTRKVIGTDVAALMMVAVMLPFFFHRNV
jgi:hypothetical protein